MFVAGFSLHRARSNRMPSGHSFCVIETFRVNTQIHSFSYHPFDEAVVYTWSMGTKRRHRLGYFEVQTTFHLSIG